MILWVHKQFYLNTYWKNKTINRWEECVAYNSIFHCLYCVAILRNRTVAYSLCCIQWSFGFDGQQCLRPCACVCIVESINMWELDDLYADALPLWTNRTFVEKDNSNIFSILSISLFFFTGRAQFPFDCQFFTVLFMVGGWYVSIYKYIISFFLSYTPEYHCVEQQ